MLFRVLLQSSRTAATATATATAAAAVTTAASNAAAAPLAVAVKGTTPTAAAASTKVAISAAAATSAASRRIPPPRLHYRVPANVVVNNNGSIGSSNRSSSSSISISVLRICRSFTTACNGAEEPPRTYGRRHLRFVDKSILNATQCSSSSSSSSSSSKDVIVSLGSHSGSKLGRSVMDSDDMHFHSSLPSSRRNCVLRKPLLPIEPRNLRQTGLKRKKKRRGRGDKCSAKGIRLKRDKQGRFKGPKSRTFEGGETPLYRRLPKWPNAWIARQRKKWEAVNLAKVRRFIEMGRLDARFPITQRHLHDSRCVKVRRGVHLFNVNDYPFPYKISIEVSSADQSSIDAIRRVGGEVRVVYRHPLNLRAHVKPYKFDVLPKTARPDLEAVHFLEKLRARGCTVSYIKPLWLEEEEKRLEREMQELWAETEAPAGAVAVPPRKADAAALAVYRKVGLKATKLQQASEDSKEINTPC